MRLIRKISIILLATAMKVAAGVYRAFRPVGRGFGVAFFALGKILFVVSLPVYGAAVSAKRVALKFYAPLEQRTRILHLFTRRFFFHLTFAAITLTVVAANLNASEVKRDEFVYSNVFTSLAQGDQYGDREEIFPPTIPPVRRYHGTMTLERGLPPNAALEQEFIPSTIEGGSAMVKPVRLTAGASSDGQAVPGVPRTDLVTYTVEEGDTISGVAVKFGISINTILWENNLTAYSIIRPGQKLAILPASGVRHKVAKGENLSKISAKYGVDAAAVIAANKLASADDLQIGELLLIPGGKKPRPVPTYVLRRPSAAPVGTAPYAGGRLVWPATCQRITQYFGWRHTGLDVACASSSTVFAAEAGKVIKAQGGWNGGYGIMVVIQHAGGLQTLYGHNSKLYVQVGDEVTRGQAIAAIGSTGRSTGPHVHFEVRSAGYRKNPLQYLR